MDVNENYCGDHFIEYVSQIFMLYTLDLYTVICQSYLNKSEKT